MNQKNFILRLALKYGNFKGNYSGPYRDQSLSFAKKGPYRDGGL